MAKTTRNMDNLFKGAISDYELTGKTGNWELMNHLLNEQERKKKKRILFFFLLSFLIIPIAVAFLLRSAHEEIKNTGKNLEIVIPSVVHENNPSQADNNPLQKKHVENSQSTKAADTIEKTLHINPVPVADSSPKNIAGNHILQSGFIPRHHPVSKDPKPESVDKITITAQFETATRAPIQEVINNLPTENKLSETLAIPSVLPSDSLAIDPVSEIVMSQTPSNNDSLSTIFPNNDTVNLSSDPPVIPTASTPIEIQQAEPDFKHFNLFAGVNIYDTGSSISYKPNIAPLIGAEYRFPIAPKFSLGLAAAYSLQSGYHLRDTIVTETFFFDRKVIQQSIEIQQLHKLYFPVTCYYKLAKKHSLSGALQLCYLLNTNGNYSEVNRMSGSLTEVEKNNVQGYMDGIKPVNLSFSLGYIFSISGRFDISTRMTRELMKPYLKNYFSDINHNPKWSSQTLLIYKF